ncbi:methionine ABC transporter substrate-binding lipoprotein MetQ [Ferrimonas balearica]|uniref:methionine ABC transporter substrate-binding lipoprotein MetQ n=1 Tax=Ferrimonas balearica TaxID=44012 RepID=UPI001C9923BF|nr:methionine ABC transporter substrate-binding lipoprotein MetQ [Ferrimonas balearica]MBY5922347.1 methionine ABC transporter substrate-binding lipoprotein MetQ [Ferrimonas balearica]MBY5994313.1 methionine ABC transporter substrate-binding lipoprotein MetQ [Ferrimonas balearica]
MNLFRSLIAGAAALALTACGGNDENVLKLGAMAGPEAQVAEVAAKLAKEQFGLEVEIVPFTDYVTPNAALNDGSIDINAFQHRPYLDGQVEARGYDLVAVANTFVYPIAAYSQSIRSLDDLPHGAKVALPNDPTNLGRSLVLLEQQGLLTLKPGVGIAATPRDVVENPKQLEILELEAAQLPRALQDVSFAVINNTFAGQAGLTLESHGLFVEDKESPYVNLIVARTNNQNDPRIAQFIESYQSDTVHEKALELFNGNIVKGW